jgi:hypothetical protein
MSRSALLLSSPQSGTWAGKGQQHMRGISSGPLAGSGRYSICKGVRMVHNFPLVSEGLMDNGTVWSLREIELSLAEVEKHHLGSLPETSHYFVRTFLQCKTGNTSYNTHRIALRLPTHCTRPRVAPSSVWDEKTSRGPYQSWGRRTKCPSST